MRFFRRKTEYQADKAFITRLYDQWQLPALHYAYRLTHSLDDAQDVVGEAFVALAKKVERLRNQDDSFLEGYIISTVTNIVRSRQRRLKRHPEVGQEALESLPAPEQDQPDYALLDQCGVDRVTEALSRLPEHYQTVIRLRCLEERPFEKVAEAMDVQEVTARSLLSRARARLKQILEELSDDEG